MHIVFMILELAGGLAMFLYGMELTSDGIQRAAGEKLQRAVNFMTANRVAAVATGAVLTILIQSSSATTVMAVSFVNAGLLSLVQAIGVIMGANIGTTLTGWIIAAVGVRSFSIAALGVPIFGLGFFMSLMKKRGNAFRSYGLALMGFAMIFLGLDFISKAIPAPSAETLFFLKNVSGLGFLSVVLAVLAGFAFTLLIHASSATLAIVITLASQGIIDFRMAAAITLGANIGTTIDAFLASLAADVNGKRAAWAHILFNFFGTLWVLAVFDPFLRLVDFLVPGEIDERTIGAHIAMMHTVFNLANTLVLLPFVNQYAALLKRLIKDREEPEARGIEGGYSIGEPLSTPELSIYYARKEIAVLAGLAREMFSRFREDLASCPDDAQAEMEWFSKREAYADEMKEALSRYLIEVASGDIGDKPQEGIGRLLGIIDDLENVTDACLSLAHLVERCKSKALALDAKSIDRLAPYALLAEDFLRFVEGSAAGPMSGEQLARAAAFENGIDELRNDLRKMARKRLKGGKDIKTELLFIDLVRLVEKIGDYAYSISEALGREPE